MKKINTKLFGLLFMLAVGNSAYLTSSYSPSFSADEYEYSFVPPHVYSLHDLDASSLIDSTSDNDDDGYTIYEFSRSNGAVNELDDEPFPHLESVSYTDPDTFVVTEISPIGEMLQPEHMVTVVETEEAFIEDEFTGSKHERRHAASELMHDVREELHDAEQTIHTTERQLQQLEHIQEHRHVDAVKEERQQDAIEKNIAIAKNTVATATRQIQRLAHSTDNIIQKEFEPARNHLTRQLNETTNELNNVVRKADRQLKKFGRATKRAFRF